MTQEEVDDKKVTGLDALPPALRRLYEESVRHNHELLKKLSEM